MCLAHSCSPSGSRRFCFPAAATYGSTLTNGCTFALSQQRSFTGWVFSSCSRYACTHPVCTCDVVTCCSHRKLILHPKRARFRLQIHSQTVVALVCLWSHQDTHKNTLHKRSYHSAILLNAALIATRLLAISRICTRLLTFHRIS
jgi:hypothetical protein